LTLKSNQTKREYNEIEEKNQLKKIKIKTKHIVIRKIKIKLDIQNKQQDTPTLYQIKKRKRRGEKKTINQDLIRAPPHIRVTPPLKDHWCASNTTFKGGI